MNKNIFIKEVKEKIIKLYEDYFNNLEIYHFVETRNELVNNIYGYYLIKSNSVYLDDIFDIFNKYYSHNYNISKNKIEILGSRFDFSRNKKNDSILINEIALSLFKNKMINGYKLKVLDFNDEELTRTHLDCFKNINLGILYGNIQAEYLFNKEIWDLSSIFENYALSKKIFYINETEVISVEKILDFCAENLNEKIEHINRGKFSALCLNTKNYPMFRHIEIENKHIPMILLEKYSVEEIYNQTKELNKETVFKDLTSYIYNSLCSSKAMFKAIYKSDKYNINIQQLNSSLALDKFYNERLSVFFDETSDKLSKLIEIVRIYHDIDGEKIVSVFHQILASIGDIGNNRCIVNKETLNEFNKLLIDKIINNEDNLKILVENSAYDNLNYYINKINPREEKEIKVDYKGVLAININDINKALNGYHVLKQKNIVSLANIINLDDEYFSILVNKDKILILDKNDLKKEQYIELLSNIISSNSNDVCNEKDIVIIIRDYFLKNNLSKLDTFKTKRKSKKI